MAARYPQHRIRCTLFLPVPVRVADAPDGAPATLPLMPDDHSKLVPPLPIPNRTVKRLCADDSAATSVKVGYRQASYKRKTQAEMLGFFFV